jgi:hypothetical protein
MNPFWAISVDTLTLTTLCHLHTTLLHAALAASFNLQWSMETKAQTHGVIRSLHKRGDETVANNYRPITLGATVDKLYNAAINARNVAHLESTGGLHDAQQGFRAGRNALDNIFMLATTLQGRLRRKLSTFVLFLDIEKAYDSVWLAGLLCALQARVEAPCKGSRAKALGKEMLEA